jgi:hypothetical protein
MSFTGSSDHFCAVIIIAISMEPCTQARQGDTTFVVGLLGWSSRYLQPIADLKDGEQSKKVH